MNERWLYMRKYIGKNEFKILNILWKRNPLLVSEIVEMDKSLTIPTVQRLINKLQKEGIVEVADIVQSGKVLARRYKPVLKSEDYLMDELKETFPMVENRNRFCKNIVGALLNGSEDAKEIIDELEDYLIKKKEEIEKK